MPPQLYEHTPVFASSAHLLPQDFLTSAYLLTSKDRFLTRPEISQFVAYMTGARLRTLWLLHA